MLEFVHRPHKGGGIGVGKVADGAGSFGFHFVFLFSPILRHPPLRGKPNPPAGKNAKNGIAKAGAGWYRPA
jgi:hypothetical protein